MAINNIYLFTGEEKFVVQTKIQKVASDSEASEYDVITYDLEEVNLSSAITDALTLPFISKKKVIILKNPTFLCAKSNINHDIKALEKYISNPMESTILIIDASGMKINDKSKILELLRSKVICNDTKPIDETIFNGWVSRQFTPLGKEIRDDAIKLFTKRVGYKDMTNAKTEIDKLISYVGERNVITKDDVSKVVTKELQNDIFSLANAIVNLDKEKIINIYLDLIALDNDVNMIISLVTKTIREYLLTKSYLDMGLKQQELADRMNVSTQKAYHLIKNSKDIDKGTFEEYIKKLGDLDYKIKSGQVDSKTGFEFFLFGL